MLHNHMSSITYRGSGALSCINEVVNPLVENDILGMRVDALVRDLDHSFEAMASAKELDTFTSAFGGKNALQLLTENTILTHVNEIIREVVRAVLVKRVDMIRQDVR